MCRKKSAVDTPDINPRDLLELVAAKHALGLVHSWEIPPVADHALNNGLYSESLAELAIFPEGSYPTKSEVEPLFAHALEELGIPVRSKAESAWYLADHCIRRIISEQEHLLIPLNLLVDVSLASQDVLPDKEYVGAALDLGYLIGNYYSYSEPTENYHEPEKRLITDETERRRLLDGWVREESRSWLERHPHIGKSNNDSPARH